MRSSEADDTRRFVFKARNKNFPLSLFSIDVRADIKMNLISITELIIIIIIIIIIIMSYYIIIIILLYYIIC